MADFEITQSDAEKLLKKMKYKVNSIKYLFPEQGGILKIPLKTENSEDDFILDIRRSNIELKKNTFQTRVKNEIILARLDLGGPPHRNPDGQEILCPHLHLHREGYGDKWAYPLPVDFTNPNDAWLILNEFMDYCNIVDKPDIRRN